MLVSMYKYIQTTTVFLVDFATDILILFFTVSVYSLLLQLDFIIVIIIATFFLFKIYLLIENSVFVGFLTVNFHF